jgi:GMP synthase (glutamine-hydrolysing)
MSGERRDVTRSRGRGASDAEFLVLQHVGCEPPAAYEDELRARGIGLARVELDVGGQLPDWRRFAGIIAMGGPMGAYEEEKYAWLRAEKELIREAVQGGLPFWGVCLGSQLLAASLGARVYPGDSPEVGIEPVWRTAGSDGDPIFAHAPKKFVALHWHNDTFDLPAGATLLASSKAYRNQAFVWGRAYGLQFHLEVNPELATSWVDVPAYHESLEAIQGEGALPRLVEELKAEAPRTLLLARQLFSHWLEDVVQVERGVKPTRRQTSSSA